ncbi:MAG: ATPase domain-containing protein [Halobacteria archaeon]
MTEVADQIAKAMQKKHKEGYYQGTAPPLKRERSGIPGLDYIMGGGLPKGRVVEVYSETSMGKTSIACAIAQSFLQRGQNVVFEDMERTTDQQRLTELELEGQNNFHYARPDDGANALEGIEVGAVNGAALGIVDSVPFLLTEDDMETELDKHNMSPQARLLSRYQPRIVPLLEQNDATLLFINQLRASIGGNPWQNYHSSGGKALEFLTSIKIYLSSAGKLDDGSGVTIKFRTEKNKTHPPRQICLADLKYEEGLDPITSMRYILKDLDLLENSGSNYFFCDALAEHLGVSEKKIANGKAKVDAFFRNNPELYEAVYSYLLSL